MKYQPPFDPALTGPVNGVHNQDNDASYANGNPQTGFEGSIPPAESFEHPQREIVEVIEWSGQTPDHEDLEQLRKALQWLVGERLVKSVGGAVPVYGGIDEDDEAHVIRSIEAGSNITVDLVETPPGSGLHKIRISSTAGGGVGGAGDPLVNIGDGAHVYKGNITDQEQLRSLKGTGGIVVTQNANDITVDGSALGGGGDGHVSGDVIIRQRIRGTIPQVNNPPGLIIHTATVNPKVAGNTLSLRWVCRIAATGVYYLDWRPAGGVWTQIITSWFYLTIDTNIAPTAYAGGPIVLECDLPVPVGAPAIEVRLRGNNLTGVDGGTYEVIEYQNVV